MRNRLIAASLLVLASAACGRRVAYVSSNVPVSYTPRPGAAPTAPPAPTPPPTATVTAPPTATATAPRPQPPAPMAAALHALETPLAKRPLVVIDLRRTLVCRSPGDGDCALLAPALADGAPTKVADVAVFSYLGEDGDAYLVSPVARPVGCHSPVGTLAGMDVALRVKRSAALKMAQDGCAIAGGTLATAPAPTLHGPTVPAGTRLFGGNGEALGAAAAPLGFDGEAEESFGQRCFQKNVFAPVTDRRHRLLWCVPADAVTGGK